MEVSDEEDSEDEKDESKKEERRLTKKYILNYEPKLIFGGSLDSVTLHDFLNFVDICRNINGAYVGNNFDLTKVNWDNLMANS